MGYNRHGTGSAVGNSGLSEWGNSLAQTLLSAATEDLAALSKQVKQALSVAGVISDGQQSIRKAVAQALQVAHGLHFFFAEANMLIYEADRHAKE